MDDLIKAIAISASGLRVQGERIRTIAENLANAGTLPQNLAKQRRPSL